MAREVTLTTAGLADLLGISARQVQRLAAEGILVRVYQFPRETH